MGVQTSGFRTLGIDVLVTSLLHLPRAVNKLNTPGTGLGGTMGAQESFMIIEEIAETVYSRLPGFVLKSHKLTWSQVF